MLRKHPLTTPKPRKRRGARVLAVLATVAATVLVTAQSASAAPFFPDTGNPPYSSDPHLTYCGYLGDTGRMTICLYASVDDGNGNGSNYPMRYTKLWTIETYKDWKDPQAWTYRGIVAREDQLGLTGRHFWAPAGYYDNNANYLFVPDVVGNNVNRDSRIFLFRAPHAIGPYEVMNNGYPVNTPTGYGAPNGGYASDPFVVRAPYGTYLFYANGTYDNCGGVSRVQLNANNLAQASNYQRITFTGGIRDDLGTCQNGDPYIEGPAVYSRDELYNVNYRWPVNFSGIDNHRWIMMFSVKPTKTPTGTNPNSGSQAVRCNGSNQQALAYATAQNITDTQWTYRGIIMCPRGASWTNHGSLLNFERRNVIVAFHDGPANYHQRRVMLDCLTWDSNGRLRTVPVSQNNAANCNNWGNTW